MSIKVFLFVDCLDMAEWNSIQFDDEIYALLQPEAKEEIVPPPEVDDEIAAPSNSTLLAPTTNLDTLSKEEVILPPDIECDGDDEVHDFNPNSDLSSSPTLLIAGQISTVMEVAEEDSDEYDDDDDTIKFEVIRGEMQVQSDTATIQTFTAEKRGPLPPPPPQKGCFFFST
jgi:hypothetical protein